MPKSLRKIDNKIIEYEILKDNPINDLVVDEDGRHNAIIKHA